MESIELIRGNLARSATLTLAKIEDMRAHATVRATPHGGGHTLWVLGHLAYVERLVVHTFLRDEPNPLAHWEEPFDGGDVPEDDLPSFDAALDAFRAARSDTLALAHELDEPDLDRRAAACPAGHEELFGTYRAGLQYLADHALMHRGQLADARRAARIDRMWL